MDRLTEDVGGWNNASTWDDLTNYYEVIPSNYIESLLWAEAERMVNLQVDKENFDSERDVVKEEYRQGVLAQPYGRLFQYIDGLSFTKHPYKRGVIGNIDELNAASIEDAEKFYKTFYRPDNAALIVVGDFDQKQLDDWIDKYFGKIQKPSGEIPRVKETEPERTKEIRFEKTAPNVPLPAMAMTFLAPPSTSDDVPALTIAEAILSDGESSRLYQSIVRNQQLASSVAFNADIRKDKGLLYFFAVASAGKSLGDIEKAILAEIKKLQDTPPTEKELEKAKNKLITDILLERETNNGKANALGRAIIFDGNPNSVNQDIAKLQAVTAKDVQDVLRKYLGEDKQVVIYYTNEESKGDENESK
jgi:zinc protease